jgi:molybdopterin converting factor small subunit
MRINSTFIQLKDKARNNHMQIRSEEQIVKEIKETHDKLASLHEELFSKLSLNNTVQDKEMTKDTHNKEKKDTMLKEGDQVEVLTRVISANKGDQATVTRVNKLRIGTKVNRNDRTTQRKPQNLRLIGA